MRHRPGTLRRPVRAAAVLVLLFASGCMALNPSPPIPAEVARPSTEAAPGGVTPAAQASGQPLPETGSGGTAPLATVPATPAGQAVPNLSPLPGSLFSPPATTIAVRYGDSLSASDASARIFDVTGSASGPHGGRAILADDRQTVLFKPNRPFLPQETVHVKVSAWIAASGTTYPSLDFSFGIAPAPPATIVSTTGQIVLQHSATPEPGGTAPYVTAPADLPNIRVLTATHATAPGLIFASNFQLQPGPSGYYLLILDDDGQLVYYQKLADNTRALDFKAQPDGSLSYADDARNAYVIMDNTYHEVRTVTAGNGYAWTDEHDLQALPNGHYLLMANEVRTLDLSQVVAGGNPQAQVTSQVVQELDGDGNVVFQWPILDHIPITETGESLTQAQIDFSHANALALDLDGNLLLSSRHLDEITKIDRRTGAILWKLGGKANQFAFSAAPGIGGPVQFYHQHDIRMLPNGHITVFDNHNGQQPQASRALEYALDQQAHTATLVWQYPSNPTGFAVAMGNVQRLDNGNTMIGWGTAQNPNLEEVTPDGSPVLALDLSGSNVTYRAFRLSWHGRPSWPPVLVPQVAGNTLMLAFSWNGATDVASYQVYGGDRQPPATLLSQPGRQGFETRLAIPAGQDRYCYYQVRPLDSSGKAGPPSTVVRNPLAPASCPP